MWFPAKYFQSKGVGYVIADIEILNSFLSLELFFFRLAYLLLEATSFAGKNELVHDLDIYF